MHEESITGKEDVAVGLQVKGRASWRVSWRVKDSEFDSVACDGIAVLNKAVDYSGIGRGQANELCLNIQMLEQRQVGLVDGGRHTPPFLQIIDRADVIDMRVSADDLLRF